MPTDVAPANNGQGPRATSVPGATAYVALENKILGAEADGVVVRWQFGKALLAERIGKQLPKGRLAEIAAAVNLKNTRELHHRMRLAELYPTETQVRTAVHTYKSWTAIRQTLARNHQTRPVALPPDTKRWLKDLVKFNRDRSPIPRYASEAELAEAKQIAKAMRAAAKVIEDEITSIQKSRATDSQTVMAM